MIALFYRELQDHVESIEKHLKGKSIEDLQSILKSICAIKGGAKLVQKPSIERVARELETLLKQAIELAEPLDHRQCQVVQKATGLFKEIYETQGLSAKEGELKKLQQEIEASEQTIVRLFFIELERQIAILSESLLIFEQTPNTIAVESLLRAAHSIKGAARAVGYGALVGFVHSVEEVFTKWKERPLSAEIIETLFSCIDLLYQLTKSDVRAFSTALYSDFFSDAAYKLQHFSPSPLSLKSSQKRANVQNATVRVTADYLTQLMGLAGELLIESRWLEHFSETLLKIKRGQNDLLEYVDHLQSEDLESRKKSKLQQKAHLCSKQITTYMNSIELFIRRHSTLSDRLYRQVIESRMCPFSDGVENLPRLVRDLAKQLNKKIYFEIIGKSTAIDREILGQLKAPLEHLLKNAIDHGIELPEERVALGKPVEGHIRLEARHKAGMLHIVITDDGRGLDLDKIKLKAYELRLIDSLSLDLTETKLVEFLFLPGFTTAEKISEISGRGIGLNAVQDMIQQVHGQVQIAARMGKGATFCLQLPLTLSVIRALMVSISGEPYAFALARIEHAVVIESSEVETVAGLFYFYLNGKSIALVFAHQVLGVAAASQTAKLSVVVLSNGVNYYGVIVDALLGEKELVAQKLDPTIAKIDNIACGAFMENGDPILVIDTEEMIYSINRLFTKQKSRDRTLGMGE